MNAWNGLVKKEFRLGLSGIYGALVVIGAIYGFLLFLTWKFDDGAILFTGSLAIVIFNVIFLPVYLAKSLYTEKDRMHMWLHNPHSGYQLLLAKFVNGLIAMILFICLTSIITFVSGHVLLDIFVQTGLSWSSYLLNGLNIVAHVLGGSIYLTVWGVFLWALALLLQNYLGKYTWVVLVPLILIGFSLLSKWEESKVFESLTHWGAIPLDIFTYPIVLGKAMFQVEINETMIMDGGAMSVIFIGTYVYYIMVALVLFFLSGWILDRKVEV